MPIDTDNTDNTDFVARVTRNGKPFRDDVTAAGDKLAGQELNSTTLRS